MRAHRDDDRILLAGADVWVPCEVVSGPFPDERNVWLDSPEGRWAGFVDPRLLREDVAAGKTAIRATIVEVRDQVVSARLPGQTHTRYLTCPKSWIQDVVGG